MVLLMIVQLYVGIKIERTAGFLRVFLIYIIAGTGGNLVSQDNFRGPMMSMSVVDRFHTVVCWLVGPKLCPVFSDDITRRFVNLIGTSLKLTESHFEESECISE